MAKKKKAQILKAVAQDLEGEQKDELEKLGRDHFGWGGSGGRAPSPARGGPPFRPTASSEEDEDGQPVESPVSRGQFGADVEQQESAPGPPAPFERAGP